MANFSKVGKALLPTKYLDEITSGIGKSVDFLSDAGQQAAKSARKAIDDMIDLLMMGADKFKMTIDELLEKIFAW